MVRPVVSEDVLSMRASVRYNPSNVATREPPPTHPPPAYFTPSIVDQPEKQSIPDGDGS